MNTFSRQVKPANPHLYKMRNDIEDLDDKSKKKVRSDTMNSKTQKLQEKLLQESIKNA